MNKKLMFLVVLLVPIVVISFIYKTNYFFEKEIENNTIETKIKLKDKNKIKEINIDDYIIGVVGCEMPASFNIEALKAQAVASRTYALKHKKNNEKYDIVDSINNQCYNTKNELKDKWKNNYNNYYNKIKKAVLETKNEVITYNNDLIIAFYFAMSNGYTENSENVFKEKKPYLKQVKSNWETNRKDYIEKIEINKDTFLKKINTNKKNLKIKILSKTPSGRVNVLRINNKEFKGTEFRKMFHLRSTDFNIKEKENKIIITTKGYGHGVGMSQYGANGLANEGKNYEEIIKYYYKDTQIKKV